MWPLERTQDFSKTCSRDLIFVLTRPTNRLVRDIIKAHIVTKFHKQGLKIRPPELTQSKKKIAMDDAHHTTFVSLQFCPLLFSRLPVRGKRSAPWPTSKDLYVPFMIFSAYGIRMQPELNTQQHK